MHEAEPLTVAAPPRERQPRSIGRLALGLVLAGVVAAAAVAVTFVAGEGPAADTPPLGEVVWTSQLGRQSHLDVRGGFVDQWSWLLEGAAVDEWGIYVPLPVLSRAWGMHALDAATGAVRWADLQTGGQLLARDEVLVRLSGTGALALVDAATGQRLHLLQVEGSVAFDVAVTDGTVIARDRDHHRVHGFDVSTGARRWHRPTEEESLLVAGAEGLVLLVDRWRDPTVTVLDALTGEERWSRAVPLTEIEGGAIAHGRVLLAGRPHPSDLDEGDSVTVALDALTSSEVWRLPASPWSSSLGLPHTGGTAVLHHEDGLRGVDVTDGHVLWEVPGAWSPVHPRSVGHGRVNVWTRADPATPGIGALLVALDAATGSELWRRPGDQPVGLSAVVGPDETYLREPHGLTAIDGRTGAVRWTHARPDELRFHEEQERSCLPAAGGGGVYASGSDGLVATDVASGDRRWAYLPFVADRSSFGAPAVSEETVAVLSSSSAAPLRTTLHILDASWGGLRSSRELQGFASGPPVLHGRNVYLGGAFQEGSVLRVHARTGRVWWRQRVDGRVLASPAVAGETVYVATGRALVALDVTTGETQWELYLDDLAPVPPVVLDGRLVVGQGTRLVAFDTTTVRPLWAVDLGQPLDRMPVVAGSTIVVIDDRDLVGLDAEDGAVGWRRTLPQGSVAGLVAVGDRVVVATRAGDVLAYEAATGESAGSVQAGARLEGELAADGQTVFVCGLDGTLHALR